MKSIKLFLFLGAALVAASCSSQESKRVEKLERTPELVIVRNINASRDQVWKTWTEPERIKQWWGPRSFTAPVIKNELRTGGKYLYAMKDQEGKVYWSTGTYKEIVPFKKITATDSFANEKGEIISGAIYGMPDMPKELLMTTLFEEESGQTKVTLKISGLPPGENAKMAEMGWNETLDKLESAVPKKK